MKDIFEQPYIESQIRKIQKEIRETPYHKGTEHHIGRLRARIARLKDKEIQQVHKKSGGREGYAVKHQGDATVILLGAPSVGKSTLINRLTNTKSKVAPYAFTTVSVIPGMMDYKSSKIQVLDVPGLIEGAVEGKGRGREVLSVARGADLLLIMADVNNIKTIENIKSTLYRNGIRINETKPQVIIDKKMSGGIVIHSNIKQDFSKETVKEIASEFGLKNAEITIKEKLSMNRLIDSFLQNRVYIPSINIVNKIDLKRTNSRFIIPDSILISAEKDIGIEKLKDEIWKTLNFVTIYLIKEEEKPNFNNPIIMKEGQTIGDILIKLGTNFSKIKKSAIIWGVGAKFSGQEASLSTKIYDRMQVRFI